MESRIRYLAIAMLLLGAFLLFGGKVPGIAPSKPDSVVYVYEKDATAVPPAVTAALNKLNRDGIRATRHQHDTTNGFDQVPAQYKLAVPAAVAAGMPALVVEGGGKVLRVKKDPKTEQDVLEAVQ